MPLGLFGNKFTPKKTPPRRAQSLSNLNLNAEQSRNEFGVDYGGVKLNLGGQEVAFENGLWVADAGVGAGGSQREVLRLKKTNQQMHEENNLLKLKVDILLDMLQRVKDWMADARLNDMVKRMMSAYQAALKSFLPSWLRFLPSPTSTKMN